MNWSHWRSTPWLDTRARFVASVPKAGALLDLGSSDGKTLGHIAELRPDLSLAAADIAGTPAGYPTGTDFRRVDFERDPLPWPGGTFDAVTCMHVVEHLSDPGHLLGEAARVLKPSGTLYIETPHPKSLLAKSSVASKAHHVTLNFFDDSSHVRLVPVDELLQRSRELGLEPVASGTSRNWGFAAAFPFLRVLRPRSRQRFVAQLHWTGWSAFIIARRSQSPGLPKSIVSVQRL